MEKAQRRERVVSDRGITSNLDARGRDAAECCGGGGCPQSEPWQVTAPSPVLPLVSTGTKAISFHSAFPIQSREWLGESFGSCRHVHRARAPAAAAELHNV